MKEFRVAYIPGFNSPLDTLLDTIFLLRTQFIQSLHSTEREGEIEGEKRGRAKK